MWSYQDRVFGPQLPGQFDFTLFFEHVMLTLVPGGIIALTIPFYLKTAWREKRRVRSGLLLWLKLIIGLALLGIHITSLVMWQKASLFRSDVALAAAVMSLVASLGILVILYIAHTYSLQPSAFLSVFLTITALFDITMTRSYFRRTGLDTIGALQASVVVLKLMLVVLEEIPKRTLFRTEQLRSSVATETVVGFWNRAIFGWLNSLILFGYRRDLGIDDLPSIEDEFDSLKLYDRFVPHWNQANKASKVSLIVALARTVPWQAFKIMPPRLAFVGLVFSQPFLLFNIVAAVKDGASRDTAHGLIGATALIFTGIAITRALYEHSSYRLVTFVRAILVVAIYNKMHRLPAEELANSAAVTLMTTDTAAVEQMLEMLYEVSSSAILVGLGVWALSVFVGKACFLMLIPGICSVVASHFLGITMTKARTAWNQEIETRVAATSNILAQIKGIKAMGLSDVMSEYLQEKRRVEIATSMQDRRARIWLFALAALSFVLTPVLVLAGAYFWTRKANPLSAAEVFGLLAIVNVASEPFMTLLNSFMLWSGGLASLGRIQKFLCLDEVHDMREGPADLTEKTDSATSEKKVQPSGSRPTHFAVEFDVVAVTSALMGPILTQVSLRIPWGALAILWGPINCGKSTLLKCILGETKLDAGVVKVGTKSIAYCSQETWLQNGTLRGNVIGVLNYVEARYRLVITCCGLDPDIASFPNGDQFMTGTGGCNLSGGQKQRVMCQSLARAAYAQTDIMVVDNMFSALDPDTAQFVFTNLFGPEGLVRGWGCTVIMTTNQLHLLDDADLIFRMHKGGRVVQEEHDISDGSSTSSSASDNCSNDDDADDDEVGTPASNAPAPAARELPSLKPTADDIELGNARRKRNDGDWSLYRYFLGSAGVTLVLFWICFVAVAAVIQAMPAIFIKIWYNRDAGDHYYFIGYVAFSVVTIIFNTLAGAQYFFQIVPRSSEELHNRMIRTVMFSTHQYLSRLDSGHLLNKFSQDMSLISQYLPIVFMQFVYMCFSVLVEIGIVASGSPYASPIIISILVVLFVIQYFYLHTSRQLRLLELESTSDLFTHFTETGAGIHHIRSFGWQQQFLSRLHIVLDKSQRPLYFLFCCQRWLTLVLDFTTAGASLCLVALSLEFPMATSDAAVGLAFLSLIGLSGSASMVIRSWTDLETGLGAISRVKDFCTDTPLERDTLFGPELDKDWPALGRLDLNCISASYTTDNGNVQRALDNVTLTILPGQKVGISGHTGSGKSSLFMAILRMVEFTGAISIDGRNTTSISRELLRSRITTLMQDGIELKGSVRFNIYPFAEPKPHDREVISTLETLGIWHPIERNGGLDGDIANLSFSISHKQLFFLARGILHNNTMNTKVVLMDEVTSAMDADADEQLRELIDEAFAGCTILQISHREGSVRNADFHIRLDCGRLMPMEIE